MVKLSYVGDTVTLIPIVNSLKDNAPGITLDVMVNKGTEELLAYHPYIRNVYAYDRESAKSSIATSFLYHAKLIKKLRSEKYDFIIDFKLGDRSSFIAFMTGARTRISYNTATKISLLLMNHIIDLNPLEHHIVDFQLEALKFFNFTHFRRSYEIYIPDEIQTRIDRSLELSGVGCRSLNIAIHPGARKKARQWRSERFGEIAERLKRERGARIVLIGGPNEGEVVHEVEDHMGSEASLRATNLTLLEMAALLKRCHLFLGNDSAPGHIAAGVQCPTLTLFGPEFPHLWRPISPHGEVLFKNPPCCRCRHEVELCVRPENNCMDMITVDEVWVKVENLLNKVYSPVSPCL